MPNHIYRIVALVTILLVAIYPATTRAQDAGTIGGTVINQTTGQTVPDAQVTLSAFSLSDDAQPELVSEWSTTTDASGNYEFVDMDTTEGLVYAASVTYRGMLYSSGMIRFLDSNQQSADIHVFETTTDSAVVHVNSRGLVLSELNPEVGEVTMLDIVSLEVEGDMAFVAGDTARSVEFPVPRNALSVTPMPGFDFGTPVVDNSVVYSSAGLRPEGGNATLSYLVRYTNTGFSLDIRHAYPTEMFRVLVPTDLTAQSTPINVSAAGMQDDGITTIGDRDYHVWSISDLDRDAVVRVSFRNLPESGFEPNSLMVTEPAILAGVALAAATGATAILVRRKNLISEPEPVTTEPLPASVIDSRDELVVQLHELQDEYANGLIDDELYLSERRSLLERLRIVSRHLRDEPVSEPE